MEWNLEWMPEWMPEWKPLVLARQCHRGWDRLVPPRPAAPMTWDLCRACATVAALRGEAAAALAYNAAVLEVDRCSCINLVDPLPAQARVPHAPG